MTLRQKLNSQADQVEAVLMQHRVHATIEGGTVTPRVVRYRLQLQPGVTLNRLTRLSEELALALGSASVRIFRDGGEVHLEVPRPGGTAVKLLDLLPRVAHRPSMTAVLGLDGEGIPLLLRLSSPDVSHVLISGMTGSGKTALARSIIFSLATNHTLSDLGLVLIDPKGRGYAPFASLPHLLRPVAANAEDALAYLTWLVAEMERRDHERISLPRIVLFIDELADLMMVGGKAVEKMITRLVQRGREAGVHVVACTQKPSSGVIGSLLKSNFPVRIVGSVASAEDARVASGMAGSGAEKLGGRGDFLVVIHGAPRRLQGAYITEAEIAQSLVDISRNPGSHQDGPLPPPHEQTSTRLLAQLRRVAGLFGE